MTEWTVNNKLNDWYQKQYHIKLPKKYETKSEIYFGGSSFSPASLFSSTAIGIWLDPSDLSTMFSDRAGTTPVTTPGTVVGLRLDKSKGLVLGSELVVNGDFSGGATGWILGSGWAVAGGAAAFTTGSTGGLFQSTTLSASKRYRVTFEKTGTGSCQLRFGTGGTPQTTVSGQGTISAIIQPDGTSFVGFYGDNAGSFTIDNISVRELAGNHAVAPTDAARPIYGVEPKGGRRNLLTWSEDFRTTAQAGETRPWLVDGTTITADFGTAPDGTITADRMVTGAGVNAVKLLHQSLSLASGTHTFSVYVKDNGSTARSVAIFFATPTLSATVGTAYNFDTDTLTNDANAAPFTIVSSNRTSVGSGWFRLSVAVTVASAQTVRLYIAAPYAPAQAGNYLIWGAQLELGSTATNYQRVTSAFDVTESGVATCHYVQYDGSDDSMSTSAIDFTATDKMSVFAGVRKLSDAAVGVIAELFTSAGGGGTTGTFVLHTQTSPVGYRFAAGSGVAGAAFATNDVSVFTSPISNVITALSDFSAATIADENKVRVNGVSPTQTIAGTVSTGSYSGVYPLYIGRRGNASLPFNGKDYGLIVVGKAASAGEITDTELWLSDKTAEVDVAKSISPNIYTRSGDTILDRANSIIERRTV